MILVETITVMSGGMSISWRGFYAVTKLIFIHSTTNFYTTSVPKTFLRILTGDSIHPIGHHMPWFRFQILEKDENVYMFLCSRSQVSIVDESMMLVEAITVVPGGMFISRRGFYAVTKLFFIHQTTNFYATPAPKTFLRIQSAITCHDSNFKFMNFIFFKKIFTVDLELCTKMSGVQWWKPFLNRMLHWEIIMEKRKRLDWVSCMYAYVSLVRLCLVERPAHGEVFMR